jgi:2-phosphosulfolactate phosphatase
MAALDVDVVLLPKHLTPHHADGRAVVAFDVLRATTSITAALAAGVGEIRIFGDIDSAAAAANEAGGNRLLCGEINCLPPSGFDLGNSPGQFRRDLHAGRHAFLSTTNGTKALIAAQSAPLLLAGSITNAAAVARKLADADLPITLLCAGTGGEMALEDLLGCGAVLHALLPYGARPVSDAAALALYLFDGWRDNLPQVMREAIGGKNLLKVGLAQDIDFCARLDVFNVVGIVKPNPLRVVAT